MAPTILKSKSALSFLYLFVAALFAGCNVGDSAGSSEAARVTAIVNVTVIPMDSERLLSAHTVIIRDGLIAEVGPSTAVKAPAGGQSIDATGLYLIPGLIDAHVHLRDPSELLSYLAHGVTTVVQLSGPSGNVPDVVDLRGKVARGEITGPNIYTTGRVLDGSPPIFPGVSTVVRTPEEAKTAVETQLAAGVDFVKVYNNLRADVLQAVIRVAHERDVAVWGHIPRVDGRETALQRALAAGLDVIAHGEEIFFTMLYGDVESQLDRGLVPTVGQDLVMKAVSLIHASGATVIPNLSFVAMTRAQLEDVERLWTDPEARFLHPTIRNMWRQQNPTTRKDLTRFDLRERGKQAVVRRLTRALNESKVPLLLGTDASAPGMFPGKSAHIELIELVAAGLTPYQALAAGTVSAGRILSRQVHGKVPIGTVSIGSRADIVLLKDNPLADITNAAEIVGVIVRGQWYTRGQIDTIRVRRAAEFAR